MSQMSIFKQILFSPATFAIRCCASYSALALSLWYNPIGYVIAILYYCGCYRSSFTRSPRIAATIASQVRLCQRN